MRERQDRWEQKDTIATEVTLISQCRGYRIITDLLLVTKLCIKKSLQYSTVVRSRWKENSRSYCYRRNAELLHPEE